MTRGTLKIGSLILDALFFLAGCHPPDQYGGAPVTMSVDIAAAKSTNVTVTVPLAMLATTRPTQVQLSINGETELNASPWVKAPPNATREQGIEVFDFSPHPGICPPGPDKPVPAQANWFQSALDCGFNVPFLISFLAAVALSMIFGVPVGKLQDWAMRRHLELSFDAQLKEMRDSDPNHQLVGTREDTITQWMKDARKRLDQEGGGAVIGAIERPIYIFAVMDPTYIGVLTAWVVFKAWFSWIRIPQIQPTAGIPTGAGVTAPVMPLKAGTAATVAPANTGPAAAGAPTAPVPTAPVAPMLGGATTGPDPVCQPDVVEYHYYLYGNAISLILGIACGVLGIAPVGLICHWAGLEPSLFKENFHKVGG